MGRVNRYYSIVLGLLSALFFSSCTVLPPQPSIEEQRISMAPYQSQLVQGASIENFGAERSVQIFNDKGAGLASMISPDGYYLTALHVIEGSQAVIFGDKKDLRPLVFKDVKRGSKILLDANEVAAFEVKTVCTFPEMDLALVKSRAKTARYFRLANSRPSKNSVVFSAANPFVNQTAGGMVYATRIIKTPTSLRRQPSVSAWDVYSSAPLRQGDSGGPLFNKRGELIAVNVSVAMKKGADKGFHHSQSSMITPAELRKIIARDRQSN